MREDFYVCSKDQEAAETLLKGGMFNGDENVEFLRELSDAEAKDLSKKAEEVRYAR